MNDNWRNSQLPERLRKASLPHVSVNELAEVKIEANRSNELSNNMNCRNRQWVYRQMMKSWSQVLIWMAPPRRLNQKYFKDHVKRIKLLTTTNWLDYLLYRRTKNGFHNICCYVFIIKAVKISLIFTDSRSNNSIYVQLLLILQYAFIC